MKLRNILLAGITSLAIGVTGLGVTAVSSPVADAATPCTSQLFKYDLTAKACVKYIQTIANAIDQKHASFLGKYTALVVDGQYGAKTKAAILNIQSHSWIQPANGDPVKPLAQDGITGPDTWMILCVWAPIGAVNDYGSYAAFKAAGCSAYETSHSNGDGWVLAASKPNPLPKPTTPTPLKATLSPATADAKAQVVSVNVTSCPGPVTLTFPWWAMPTGVNGEAGKSKGFSCSGSTTIKLQLITNTWVGDRTSSITVSSGGQNLTLTLTQKAAASKLNYVALGDSYSAGAGTSMPDASGKFPEWKESSTSDYDLPKVYMRTNFNTVIQALPSKRNTGAWPVLLANQANLQLVDFRASTGAYAYDIFNTPSASRKVDSIGDNQSDRVRTSQLAIAADPAKVDVVTITIGGNDAGFADFVKGCVLNYCSESMADAAVIKAKLGNLTAAYQAILNKFPNATVYVVAYPQAAPPSSTSTCEKTDIGHDGALVNGQRNYALDPNWPVVRKFTERVNSQIKLAVNAMNNPRMRYVDITQQVDYPGYFCAGSSKTMFVTGILEGAIGNIMGGYPTQTPQDNESMAHQNAAGQQAYANAVQKALRGTKGDLYGA